MSTIATALFLPSSIVPTFGHMTYAWLGQAVSGCARAKVGTVGTGRNNNDGAYVIGRSHLEHVGTASPGRTGEQPATPPARPALSRHIRAEALDETR